MTSMPSSDYRQANLLKKRPIPIVLQTSKHLIRGKFHVRGEMRVIDELAVEDKFIAITDGEILSYKGNRLFKTEFIAVNRQDIVWIVPEENIIAKGELDAG
jgi:hypothetical protein